MRRVQERLYRMLMRAYPRGFQERHQADLLQSFREWGAAPRFRGRLGAARFWWFILDDLIRSVVREHWQAVADGDGTTWRQGEEAMFQSFIGDVTFALRSFRRSPSFFFVAVVTLAVGVGATTTMFSVLDGVVLSPLPYPDAERIVVVGQIYDGRDGVGPMSPLNAFDIKREVASFEAFSPSRSISLTLLGDGDPEQLSGAAVSGDFFRVVGAEPAVGRVFTEEDDGPDKNPVAVLSHGLWLRRWGGDPDLIGRVLTLSGTPFTVIGVLAPNFYPPEAIYQGTAEVWIPLTHVNDDLTTRANSFLQGVAKLRAGVSFTAAREELSTLAGALSEEYADAGPWEFGADPLRESTVGAAPETLLPLMGAVALLLLIACVNVANLTLMRSIERAREMALRTALGARRTRLIRQLVSESLTLGLIGGGAGVGLAYAGVEAFTRLNPGDIPRIAEIGVDVRVLMFALSLSIVTALLFGLAPTVMGTRSDPNRTLKTGGRGSGTSAGQERLKAALVISETALALVLLVGAGLLINSFVRLNRVDPGFAPGDAYSITASLGPAGAEEQRAFWGEVVRRVQSIPGVTAVGTSNNLPLSGNRSSNRVSVEGSSFRDNENPPAVSYHRVSPGFFDALGVPLRGGRGILASDDAGTPFVAVVNESAARDLFGEDRPLGRRFQFGRPDPESSWYEVVGVVTDVRQRALATEGAPEVYLSFDQRPTSRTNVIARSTRPVAEIVPAMRQALWSVRPDLPIQRSIALDDFVARSITAPRFYTALLTAFASAAFLLALVGIYGTLAHTVSARSHEVGIRIALGASSDAVIAMILMRGLRLVIVGLMFGTVAAIFAGRTLEAFIFGVTPTDPVTLMVVGLTLLVTAALACLIPARRAARLDPVVALRAD